jgi:DNA-binding beta-propeller fold protein YncE
MAKNLVFLFLLVCSLVPAQDTDMEAVQALEDFRWGLRAFHSGSFEDSILSLEKSLSRKPQDLRTRYWLAGALYRAGFEDAALAEWRYILGQEPSDTVVDNTVDVLTYRRGLGEQLEERSSFVVASEIDGNDASAYPLKRPTSVRIREDGSVYVVAFASNEVLLLDVNNAVQRIIQGGLRGLDRPYDCLEAEDPDTGQRILFVAEYGRNQVVKMDLSGERLAFIGGKGSAAGELLGPQYLATDDQGYLYVSDWGNGRVNKYDFDGNFVLSIGRSSSMRLSGPTGIAYQEGVFFVADSSAKRIVAFDPSGNPLFSFGEGVLKAPEGIAFFDSNRLLVVDDKKLLEYDLHRETWTTLSDMGSFAGHLTHLAVSPNGEVYAVDFDANKIYILSEMAALYTSLFVKVDRINSFAFPDILVEVTVEDRRGRPIVGLQEENFIFSEHYTDIPSVRMRRAPGDSSPLELSLLVEKTPQMRAYLSDLSEAVGSLHQQQNESEIPGAWRVLSVGEEVVVETELGASRLESREAAQRGPWDSRWRLDRGLRQATSQLLSGEAAFSRRAVVLLTTGSLNRDSFSDYTLAEVTDYLQNNSIPLYVVYFGPEVDRELEFICSQTGGSVVPYFSAKGAANLLTDIRRRPEARYLLEMRSPSESGFGNNYIELQTEVVLHRKSGRTRSGYFAPLSE